MRHAYEVKRVTAVHWTESTDLEVPGTVNQEAAKDLLAYPLDTPYKSWERQPELAALLQAHSLPENLLSQVTEYVDQDQDRGLSFVLDAQRIFSTIIYACGEDSTIDPRSKAFRAMSRRLFDGNSRPSHNRFLDADWDFVADVLDSRNNSN